jgi:hypothetical protein
MLLSGSAVVAAPLSFSSLSVGDQLKDRAPVDHSSLFLACNSFTSDFAPINASFAQ